MSLYNMYEDCRNVVSTAECGWQQNNGCKIHVKCAASQTLCRAGLVGGHHVEIGIDLFLMFH